MAKQSPNRIIKEGEVWRCPPAEESSRLIGIEFRIISSRQIDWTIENNMNFLRDYFFYTVQDTEKYLCDVQKVVRENPGIKLRELIGLFPADSIYSMVAQKKIYIDLKDELLSEPEFTLVFLDDKVAKAFKIVTSAAKMEVDNVSFQVAPGASIDWNEIRNIRCHFSVGGLLFRRPIHAASTSGIKVKVQGHEFNNIKEAAKYYGRAYTHVFDRLKNGCTIEQALGLVRSRLTHRELNII